MPPAYTASHIGGQTWADPDIGTPSFQPKWNSRDRGVDRMSHLGEYQIDDLGYPLNPIGRTGLRGRGLLGRWGPNHAADPIVTRWKRDEQGAIIKHKITKKNILQMIAIQRHDNRMWAIPGGMVDPGEKISTTLKREFTEEALNSSEYQTIIEEFFANGLEVYKSYVDDQRNTDNAWIETVACNFHDDVGTKVGAIQLSAGDDAMNVKWCDIDGNMLLHANHITIVEQVARRFKAHW
uniref:Nudix hydrolase domain-containing protein n=1 Tax=Glossina brevipalpis TaxID=37001 RepID=A0A1A9WG03_9MUSC